MCSNADELISRGNELKEAEWSAKMMGHLTQTSTLVTGDDGEHRVLSLIICRKLDCRLRDGLQNRHQIALKHACTGVARFQQLQAPNLHPQTMQAKYSAFLI